MKCASKTRGIGQFRPIVIEDQPAITAGRLGPGIPLTLSPQVDQSLPFPTERIWRPRIDPQLFQLGDDVEVTECSTLLDASGGVWEERAVQVKGDKSNVHRGSRRCCAQTAEDVIFYNPSDCRTKAVIIDEIDFNWLRNR